MSPYLFKVAMEDLLQRNEYPSLKVAANKLLAYADDLVAICDSEKDCSQAIQQLGRFEEVSLIINW